jgi:hypothetical protein
MSVAEGLSPSDNLQGQRRSLRLKGGVFQEVEIPSEAQMLQVAMKLHAKRERASIRLMGWPVIYLPSGVSRITWQEFDPMDPLATRRQPLNPMGPPTVTESYSHAVCWFGRTRVWSISLSWRDGDDKPPSFMKHADVTRPPRPLQGDLLSWVASLRPEPISDAMLEAAEPEPDGDLHEGARLRVESDRYERNGEARERCLAQYGAACVACGVDFGRVYGEGAAGFIHVHHLTPLATVAADYVVDPVRDLRPVCPNCHAVIHLREPPFTIDEVRALLAAGRVSG